MIREFFETGDVFILVVLVSRFKNAKMNDAKDPGRLEDFCKSSASIFNSHLDGDTVIIDRFTVNANPHPQGWAFFSCGAVRR